MERDRGDRGADRFGALLLLPFSDEQVEQYLRHALPSSTSSGRWRRSAPSTT